MPLSDVSFFSSFFFAAAICHAGMAARPLLNLPYGLDDAWAGAGWAAGAADDELLLSGCCVSVVPFVAPPPAEAGVVAAGGAGLEFPFTPAPCWPHILTPDAGLDAVLGELEPMRFPTSVFKLLSSWERSFNLLSVLSLCASNAFGIRSRSPLTSSSSLRLSASRRLRDSFSDSMTVSISVIAESRRCVRCSSEALSAVVSVFS